MANAKPTPMSDSGKTQPKPPVKPKAKAAKGVPEGEKLGNGSYIHTR